MSTELQRQALVRDLSRRLALASHDELRVVDRILLRLELGRDRYGLLDLAQPRDWARERFEERLDALVYATCEELVLEDQHRAGQREAARVEMLGTGKTNGGERVRLAREAGQRAELAEWRDDQHKTRVTDTSARLAPTMEVGDDEPYEGFEVGGEG